mmetsp:Transcript_17212/g.28991  ORF Transcript_17212/g.28991 Transcript_17212/m.28991 type:complete len:86 (+) Transcript_17212:1670-1927(+)
MNQWIFLIDGYGMKLENQGEEGDEKDPEAQKLKDEKKLKEVKKHKGGRVASDPDNVEVFKTFIVRFIGDQEYSFYNVEQPVEDSA